jgi:hypothetical protein
VPNPRSVFRLVALAVFLVLIALGLWLLDAEWPAILVVMAAAWTLAALVEWAAWRQERVGRISRIFPHREARASGSPVPPPLPEQPSSGVLYPPAPEPEWELELEEEQEPAPRSEALPPAEPEPEPGKDPPRPTPLPPRPPLRPVPAPPPAPPRPPAPPLPAARASRPAQPQGVVDMRRRATAQARPWNLWDLERLARNELQGDPGRQEELSYLFVHLRQFASPDGSLPTEFDPLVRESLGDLLEKRG